MLILRRASTSRPSGTWSDHDFDVFDGDRDVGRIYRVDHRPELWFWGVSFELTGRKSYGRAPSLDEAKVALGMAKPMNDERRLLELLADNPNGCTESLLLAYGFRIELIALLGAGLATARSERMVAAGKAVDVTRIGITDAGRVALERRH
jgi:hypothetical protein